MILQGVTVAPGTEMLYLSGQLASPVDAAKSKAPAEMTMADFGDTKTQTISIFTKIKGILAARGYAMSDVIKLTVFVTADPKMNGKMDFAGMNDAFTTDFVAEGVAIQTMENIRQRGLIDTRFMENSTYYVTRKESTYETLLPDGMYKSQKTGYMVKRTKLPKLTPKKGEAIVANAAPYFIFHELKFGLMFQAFKVVSSEVETTAKVKYKQKAR